MKFISLWVEYLIAPLRFLKHIKEVAPMAKVIHGLIVSLGLVGATASMILSCIKQEYFLLLYPSAGVFIAYLSWSGGMAWVNAKLPTFEISDLKFDKVYKFFYVDLTNGDIPANIKVKINSVRFGSSEKMNKRSWEGQWRGRLSGFEGNVMAHEPNQYGILAISADNNSLVIVSKETADPLLYFTIVHLIEVSNIEPDSILNVGITVQSTALSGQDMQSKKIELNYKMTSDVIELLKARLNP